MEEKVLSIIIPTFNMENYIANCLNSLIIPFIDKLDIIVVNDGSKDRSSEIAHSYADKYPDSIRVIDKENGNYGSCINVALPMIKGKYLKILDADDSFDTINLNKFIYKLEDIDVDLVLTDCIKVNNKKVLKHHYSDVIPKNKILSGDYITFLNNTNIGMMHSFTYNKNVFNKLNYKQTEGISYTDTEWIIYPIKNVYSIYYYDKIIYKYLIERTGQTISPQNIIKQISHIIIIVKKLLDFYDNSTENINIKQFQYIENQIITTIGFLYKNVLFNSINQDKYEDFLYFDEFFFVNYPNLYKNFEKSLKLKLGSFKLIKYWNNNNKKKDLFFCKLYGTLIKHLSL